MFGTSNGYIPTAGNINNRLPQQVEGEDPIAESLGIHQQQYQQPQQTYQQAQPSQALQDLQRRAQLQAQQDQIVSQQAIYTQEMQAHQQQQYQQPQATYQYNAASLQQPQPSQYQQPQNTVVSYSNQQPTAPTAMSIHGRSLSISFSPDGTVTIVIK